MDLDDSGERMDSSAAAVTGGGDGFTTLCLDVTGGEDMDPSREGGGADGAATGEGSRRFFLPATPGQQHGPS
jgi:hypothetical protein